MNLGLKSGLLGGAAALALVVASVPAYAQDDISTLRQQLETMKERLAKLEADKNDKRRVSAAAAVEAGDKPRSWKLPGTNTSMNIGGFVKFSTQWSFTGGENATSNQEGSGVGFRQVEGSALDNAFNGGHFNMTARRSRFWIQTWTPTDWGELRTYIEADFAGVGGAGSNNVLRLRHAYGTLGPVLAGQTNTLFGGLIGAPEALDDGAPQALGALRVPQIRYTHNFGGGLTLSVALEDSSDRGDASAGGTLGTNCAGNVCTAFTSAAFGTGSFFGPKRWPDVTAALQWNFPNGAVYASGMVGQIDVDSGTAGPSGLVRADSAFRWGGALGARYDFGRVEIGGQGYYGQGIGWKYNAPPTGFIDAIIITTASNNNTDLTAITSYGATAYVQVKLTDTIRATAAYSWGMQEAASEVPGYYAANSASRGVLTGITNIYWSGHGNILWNPVPQVTLGAEYTYQFAAKYNGANASVNRIQFAAIYRF